MKFIKVGETVLNLALVAAAERKPDGSVELHFAVPRATLVPGVIVKQGQPLPAASDHYVQTVAAGAEADAIWAALTALTSP